MKCLSSAKVDNIHSLILSKKSNRQIQKITGVGKSTVSRIRQELEPDKENSLGGRPSKLSSAAERRIISQINSGRLDNASQAADFINPTLENPVSSQTIRNHLRKADYKSVTKAKKPLLTAAHRKKRLDVALQYKEWTVEDWKRVIWSDETKINRIGSDGHQYSWKKRGEGLSDRTTNPTVKFGGGNVMVWGCMGWNGVGKLVEVEGKMDSKQYVEILDENLDQCMDILGLSKEDMMFQQDNDPKHTSKLAKNWFKEHQIYTMEWPAQSPDINPIEHLWGTLKSKLHTYEEHPKGVWGLWERLCAEWNNIDKKECQTLIESMPRRLEAVVKAKGGHTKY